MKKKLVLLITCIFILCFLLFPIKKAVDVNIVNTTSNYIIVKVQKSSASQWIAINKNGEALEKRRDYKLIGNVPKGFNYGIESGSNIYVCFGKDIIEETTAHGDSYNVFKVDSWEIMYPIQRNSFISGVLPKNFLVVYDYIY